MKVLDEAGRVDGEGEAGEGLHVSESGSVEPDAPLNIQSRGAGEDWDDDEGAAAERSSWSNTQQPDHEEIIFFISSGVHSMRESYQLFYYVMMIESFVWVE